MLYSHHSLSSAALGEVEIAIDKAFSQGEFDVTLLLPKFKLDCKTRQLVQTFQGLGISQLFNAKVWIPFSVPQACDLTPMSGGKVGDVYVSDIVHQAVLKVDEEGFLSLL